MNPEGFLDTGESVGLREFLEDGGKGAGLRLEISLQSQRGCGVSCRAGQGRAKLASYSLDLLVDGLQLLLKHDGQCLHISLPTGGQKLSPKHPLCLLLV